MGETLREEPLDLWLARLEAKTEILSELVQELLRELLPGVRLESCSRVA